MSIGRFLKNAILARVVRWANDGLSLLGNGGVVYGIPITPELFGAVGDNVADDTVALQAWLNASPYCYGKSGANYKVTATLIVPKGKRFVDLRGATLRPNLSTYDTPLFSNDKVEDKTTNFILQNGSIIGNCVGIDLRFTKDNPGEGMRYFIDKIYYQTGDGNLRTGTSFLVADQCDFSVVTNCEIWNCDLAFEIGSAAPRRNCTQLEINQTMVSQVRTAARFQGIDKAVFNIDTASCNSGLVFAGSNGRILLQDSHGEGIAIHGYDSPSARVDLAASGYAYYFAPSQQNSEIEFNHCTVIDLYSTRRPVNPLPPGTGNGAVYIGRCDGPTLQSITFNDCVFTQTAEASPTWHAIVNRGKFRWNGRWPYTNDVSLTADGFGYIDMIINDYPDQHAISGNLLSGNTALSLTGNPAGTAVPTVTEQALGTSRVLASYDVSFNSVNQFVKVVSLPYGWNTLDVTGFRISGNPVLFVALYDSPYTERVRIQFNGVNDAQRRWRVSFWNPNAQAAHKIGFTNQSATPGVDQFNIADTIALYAGFAQDAQPLVNYEVVAALPTASSRWLNRTIIVHVAGTADTMWTCLNSASNNPTWVAK